MNYTEQTGLSLFEKSSNTATALKEMLQFIKAYAPSKTLQFAYVETETSLIPHLSLWENLQIVTGGNSWKEFCQRNDSELHHLVNLIRDPETVASKASEWEKLTISLIKATFMDTKHIIVDIDEDLHTPFNLMNFKKILTILGQTRNVFIATANTSLWLDSCHTIIQRKGYQFKIERLTQVETKIPFLKAA